MVEDERKQDNDGDRHPKQPKQNSLTHNNLPEKLASKIGPLCQGASHRIFKKYNVRCVSVMKR